MPCDWNVCHRKDSYIHTITVLRLMIMALFTMLILTDLGYLSSNSVVCCLFVVVYVVVTVKVFSAPTCDSAHAWQL